MRALVTGGAGYIGSRVTAHLLAGGFDVTVFDNLTYSGEALLPFLGLPAFTFVKGDVRDRSALERSMRGHDAVIHLAAVVGESACDLDTVAAEQINRDATASALDLAEANAVERFIFLSTCSNYGVSDAGVVADEDTQLRPLTLYARTKTDAEQNILASHGNIAATVLRLGTICGLSGRMRFDLLISEMARDAVLGRQIDIYKPDAWRPFLHIEDAARVVRHILTSERGRIAGRVFNVVGDNYQKRGLIDLVRKHFPNARVNITDARPDNRDYRVSSARIERELGFFTNHSVEDAFTATADAVLNGIFLDPYWPGHSAMPLTTRQPLIKA